MPCSLFGRISCCSFASILLLGSLDPSTAQQPLDPTMGMRLPKRSLKPAKPTASWIWGAEVRDNQAVALRGSFMLKSLPKSARIVLTADNFFKLWVNGKLMDESAPDPKDADVWKKAHVKAIASALRLGKNVIAVEARNLGGSAGFVAKIEGEGNTLLLTDKNWKVAEQDVFEGKNWQSPDFSDLAWKPATVEFPLAEGPWSGGLLGWPGYDPEVPYLSYLPLKPSIVNEMAGKFEEVGSLMLPGVTRTTVSQYNALDSKPPQLNLDFGKELTGRIEIETEGDAEVVIGTGESLEEAVNAPWGGTHSFTLKKGVAGVTPWSAFRYATVSFKTASQAKPVVIKKLILNHKYYPVAYKGSFACSDPLLTQVWYCGAYTSHLCMQEDIWDAPKRDRLRWMGDLHVSGAVINLAFADTFLMEQSMQRLRNDAQGGRPANQPPTGHVNGIPGYSCAWVCGLADFHRHLGDYDYLVKQRDGLISMMEYLRGELDERGVFANKRKAWNFVDWSPGFNEDNALTRNATHFFLTKAAKEASFLLKEMGDAPNAAKYATFAEELTHAAQTNLLPAGKLTFSDRRQDNAMAIYSGVATHEQLNAIYDTLLTPTSSAWNEVATPYYNNYVIYAMSQAGHATDTLEIIRKHWGGMLTEGATSFWEGYDPKWDKKNFHSHLQADNGTGYFVSLAHGWSAGPTSWLTERVLGVRPTSGGFKSVEIVPELGDLKWAEGEVPAPQGAIHVRAEKVGRETVVTLFLPKNIKAEVRVPGDVVSQDGAEVAPDGRGDGRQTAHLTKSGKYVFKGKYLEK